MDVTVFPYVEGRQHGNIMWRGKFPMRHGKFPPNHPVGGGFCDNPEGQCGTSEAMTAFRSRGYWASCFPEGDGITWRALNGQSDEQAVSDVAECFGWNAAPHKQTA